MTNDFEKKLAKALDDEYERHKTVTLASILGEDGMRQLREEKSARARRRARQAAVVALASLAILMLPLAFFISPLLSGVPGGQLNPSEKYAGGEEGFVLNDQMVFAEAVSPDSFLPDQFPSGWTFLRDQEALIDGVAVGALREYMRDGGRLYLFYSTGGYEQFTLTNPETTSINGRTVQYVYAGLDVYVTWQEGGTRYCLRTPTPFTIDELSSIINYGA